MAGKPAAAGQTGNLRTLALKAAGKLRSGDRWHLFADLWERFWMLFAGLSPLGRMATRLAVWPAPPYYKRRYLAWRNQQGFIAPSATIHHRDLRMGPHVFIDDRVLIFQDTDGGAVQVGERTHLWRDIIIQTGEGGSITIGSHTHIQPRCVFSAYRGSIRIGSRVQIAPHCGLYPYDHGTAPGEPISKQPLHTKGDIVIGDDAWLGFGVIVLSGVRIGRGAVVGAGSVVTRDIPDGAIAMGVPARVVRMRDGSRSSGGGKAWDRSR